MLTPRLMSLALVAAAVASGCGCARPPELGDSGPATQAHLWSPVSVAATPDGTIYIADGYDHRIREVGRDGSIVTVAGSGPVGPDRGGCAGDGGPATGARLRFPSAVACGSDGSLYIADMGNHRIRKVDPAGTITTVAGDRWVGKDRFGRRVGRFAGDGGPANSASLDSPLGLAVAADDSLYIADSANHRVRKVDRGGIITTVAGNGRAGFTGDGGPATKASLTFPTGVALGADGSLYIADMHSQRIRKVDPAGIITTVAGDGWQDVRSNGFFGRYSGDGSPATEASLNCPRGIAIGTDGSLYIADSLNHRVRKVDAAGVISTVAGDGWVERMGGKPSHSGRYAGDGGPATTASLDQPGGLALGLDGSLYIADTDSQRIRKVDAAGVISTVAGDGATPRPR